MSDPKGLPAITGSLNATLDDVTLVATAEVFQKPPKDHPIYAAVGRVAAEWAELEHRLDAIIWWLSGTSQSQAACMTSQMMGHFPRFNTIIALLTVRGAPKTAIDSVITESGKASQLAKKRARTVHDAWYVGFSHPDPQQFRARPRGELSFGMKPVSITDLETLITQIANRIEAVAKIKAALHVALSP